MDGHIDSKQTDAVANVFMARSRAIPVVSKKSMFIPIGAAWLVAGMFLAGPLHRVAAEMSEPSLVRSLAFIIVDVLRAGILFGIGFLIIGKLRNRRWKREAENAAAEDNPSPEAT